MLLNSLCSNINVGGRRGCMLTRGDVLRRESIGRTMADGGTRAGGWREACDEESGVDPMFSRKAWL